MEIRSTPSSRKAKKIYWQQQIGNWRVSGLSQKQFCQRHSLALSTFTYWKRRIKIAKTEAVKFYPLTIPAPTPQPAHSGLQLLIGKKRFVIELKEEFSATALRKLISTLEQL